MKQQNRNKEEYKTLKPSRLVGTTCSRFNALNKLEYDSRRNKHKAFPKKWLNNLLELQWKLIHCMRIIMGILQHCSKTVDTLDII